MKQHKTYYQMLVPQALGLVSSFLREEEVALRRFLESQPDAKQAVMVVIGAGPLSYLDLGLRFCHSYIGVDPTVGDHLERQMLEKICSSGRVSVLEKDFAKLQPEDIPHQKLLFVFPFNVLAYINRPGKTLDRFMKTEDIVFISTWSQTPEALRMRSDYMALVNGLGDSKVETGLYDLNNCSIAATLGMRMVSAVTSQYCDVRVLEKIVR